MLQRYLKRYKYDSHRMIRSFCARRCTPMPTGVDSARSIPQSIIRRHWSCTICGQMTAGTFRYFISASIRMLDFPQVPDALELLH